MTTIKNDYRFSNCPFCNSIRIKKLGNLMYGKNTEFSSHLIKLTILPEIWECIVCKSTFTQNAIPPKEAECLYSIGKSSQRWSTNNFEEDKVEQVMFYLDNLILRKDIKLLDMGCNTGKFLDYLKQKGIKTFGFEICKQSYKEALRKGHTVFSLLSKVNGTFDVITAFDFIEHLYDPMNLFSFAHKILNRNGYLIIVTGNTTCYSAKITREKWWYFNFPEHIVFPSPYFFRTIADFDLKYKVGVYASKAYEEGKKLVRLKNIVKCILFSNYSGLPSLSPDHQFVVLQKKEVVSK